MEKSGLPSDSHYRYKLEYLNPSSTSPDGERSRAKQARPKTKTPPVVKWARPRRDPATIGGSLSCPALDAVRVRPEQHDRERRLPPPFHDIGAAAPRARVGRGRTPGRGAVWAWGHEGDRSNAGAPAAWAIFSPHGSPAHGPGAPTETSERGPGTGARARENGLPLELNGLLQHLIGRRHDPGGGLIAALRLNQASEGVGQFHVAGLQGAGLHGGLQIPARSPEL